MQKYKVNDEIIVLSGKSKGKRGKILKLLLKRNRVLIQGLNTIKKTLKPTQDNPTGGIQEKEGSIHISNIAHFSEKQSGPSRVQIKLLNGKKSRVLSACETVLS